ncbi:hypothetical protein Tco_1211712 [Tanacetum coccineum]
MRWRWWYAAAAEAGVVRVVVRVGGGWRGSGDEGVVSVGCRWQCGRGGDGDMVSWCGGYHRRVTGISPEKGGATEKEWYNGSGRSGLDLSLLYHFCGSPEKFSGGGWPEKVAAGRREGWSDIWRRREDL